MHGGKLGEKQCILLFEWQICVALVRLAEAEQIFRIDALFEDLQGAPANRGACLDGISAIMER